MERETKTIETPVSKQKIEVKTWITGREKREINSTLFDDANFTQEELQNPKVSINAKVMNKMQDKQIEMLVISIDEKKEDILNKILNMRSEDFDFILEEIGKIINKDTEIKKK